MKLYDVYNLIVLVGIQFMNPCIHFHLFPIDQERNFSGKNVSSQKVDHTSPLTFGNRPGLSSCNRSSCSRERVGARISGVDMI